MNFNLFRIMATILILALSIICFVYPLYTELKDYEDDIKRRIL